MTLKESCPNCHNVIQAGRECRRCGYQEIVEVTQDLVDKSLLDD